MRASRARRLSLLGAAAICLGPIAACSDDGPKEGEARLEVDGRATITRQAGEREEIEDDSSDVRVGDTVSIDEGTGTMELPDDAMLELREGFEGAKSTVVVMGPVPVLEAGELLVVAPEGLEVSVADTSVAVDGGAAKVAQDLGLAVKAYDADIHLDSAGQERDVPALREMQVPALGSPPPEPQPLEYDRADPWDRRFLGAAIDLGERLEALATGYTQNLAEGEGQTVAFYRQVLPSLADEPQFVAGLLDPERSPGETLVGAAITALGRRGTFTERWESVFAFRDAGAAWGLVALDQGVESEPVLGAVTDAVTDSPLAIGPTTTVPSETDGSPLGTTAPPTTGVPNRPPPTPTSSVPPATVPPPEPGPIEPVLDPLLEPLLDPVADLLSGLLGGLLSNG